jgi:hypothetical protein
LLAALSLCVTLNCTSQVHPEESLRGLHGVFVYVHPVGQDIEAGGLLTHQVKDAVGKALRKAGIMVYGQPQPAEGLAILEPVINKVNEFISEYRIVNKSGHN